MNTEELSKEERILRVMKIVLVNVIKDTTAPPGTVHPLKKQTQADIRDALLLITEREKELAEAAGRPSTLRPHFVDEPKAQGEVMIPLHRSGLTKKDESTE
jgi:hypothetical protein